MTRVAVIGPGRVGTLLAVAASRAGYRVVAVAGGSPSARDRVAQMVAGVRPMHDLVDAAERADLLLLAVPDHAIEPVVADLARADALGEHHRVVHVAGARGVDPLRTAARAGAQVAACHPAMTVPTGSVDPDVLVGVAWAVTTRSPEGNRWAFAFVRDLGGDPVAVPADRRALYHAGLTVGSNALAAAVATARQLLLAAGVADPAAFLTPLARTSMENIIDHGAAALTGPVVRGDGGTLETHLDAIDADVPMLGATYRHLMRATLEAARPQLSAQAAAIIAHALEEHVPDDRTVRDGVDRG